jgi:transposase
VAVTEVRWKYDEDCGTIEIVGHGELFLSGFAYDYEDVAFAGPSEDVGPTSIASLRRALIRYLEGVAAPMIQVLGQLRRFLGGEKATLLWDGLPAHRSRAMRAWLATHRHWLVVERLPGYAPDLNPVESLWSRLKGTELANLVCPTLDAVVEQAERGIERVRKTPHLAYSFLRRTGLSVS